MAYPTQKEINSQMNNLHKEYQETLFKFDEAKLKGNYVMVNIYNKHLNQIDEWIEKVHFEYDEQMLKKIIKKLNKINKKTLQR